MALIYSLSVDELAWRGLALNGLYFDRKFVRNVDGSADVEIKLNLPCR
jgi:hypothetical protein